MNPTLLKIHEMLLKQHDALAKRLGKTTDSQTARMLLTEMKEILHRLDRVQGLLFRQTSKELDAAMAEIEKTNKGLSEGMEEFRNAEEFLKSTANFLSAVDQAINIARSLASLAG